MIAVCLSCHLKPLFSSFFFIIICQCCCDGYERQTWECTSWVYILSVESSLLLSIMYHSVSKVKVTSFWLTCKCIENVFFFFWPKVNRIRGEEGTWKSFFCICLFSCSYRMYWSTVFEIPYDSVWKISYFVLSIDIYFGLSAPLATPVATETEARSLNTKQHKKATNDMHWHFRALSFSFLPNMTTKTGTK